MAENPGVAPYQPDTKVGQVRIGIADTTATNVIDGIGDYNYLSDDEINGFLTQGSDSVNRSIGLIYLAWSGQAAAESLAIQDFDLKIDYSKRAANLRETALLYLGLADADDANAGDAVLIVPTGSSYDWHRYRAEAETWPVL